MEFFGSKFIGRKRWGKDFQRSFWLHKPHVWLLKTGIVGRIGNNTKSELGSGGKCKGKDPVDR